MGRASLTSADRGIVAEASPEEIGFDSMRLERLERYLQRHIDRGSLVGTLVVIARGGRVGYVCAQGLRDAELHLPVEADTIWRIYSMTKPITSVAAMMLWEEGLLSLDDPVARYVPAFEGARVYAAGSGAVPVTRPARSELTIRHLLTHTSGLTYARWREHPVDEVYRTAGLDTAPEDSTLADLVDCLGALPLRCDPGSEWNYSYSTDVLARVVEVVAEQPLEHVFRTRIFEPLDMHETGYVIAEADATRLATLYATDTETGRARPAPERDQPRTAPRSLMGGGHGLVSTAADYHRFVQMLLHGGELGGARLLSSRTIALMTANHLPGGADIVEMSTPGVISSQFHGYGFGLGFSVLIDPVAAGTIATPGIFGWSGAAGTEFWVDPAEDIGVTFFSQVLPGIGGLRDDVRRLVYQARMG
jgi:CubicO group peptidase (beta-lactamase class C family)